MTRAFALARKAEGHTSPNPMVGAVLVRDGQIVGEGYHRQAGRAHAEIEALELAGERSRGATLYVTLEPCCVQGRTPPCTEALIAAGITRVVFAVRDPNPDVDGRGRSSLEDAGIEVREGICQAEGERMIRPFAKRVLEGMPWVTVKYAMTLDGKIATRTGHSRWISSEESRRFAHQLRQVSDVIVVGAGTVVADDPLLTSRVDAVAPNHPLRVVVDSRGRTPYEAKIFSPDLPGQTVLATTNRIDSSHADRLESQGVEVWRLAHDDNGRVDLSALLREITDRESLTVLVEGGAALLGSFFERDLVDQVWVALAPKVVGGVEAPSPVGGLGVEVMGEAIEFAHIELESRGRDVWVRAETPVRTRSAK